MLMPFFHLGIINEQQGKDGVLRHFDREWHTKLEWLIKTFPGIRDWHIAMSRLSFPEEGAAHSFATDYQNKMLSSGVLQEDILRMTDSNKPYLDFENGEQVEMLARSYLTPFTTTLKNKGHMLSKTLPIYYEKENFYCFDPENNKFIQLETPIKLLKQPTVKVSELNIPEQLKNYYHLDGVVNLIVGPRGFGKQHMLKVSYIDKADIMFSNEKLGFYYGEGLYQLMLFAMGVDNQANAIEEGHPLYQAYCNFKEEMGRSKDNPWNSPYFKKENLLEYHVAQILKKDPALKEQFKLALGRFTGWKYYQVLEHLTLDSKSMAEAKAAHLPGEDLMLAYAISQNLKYLWGASLSEEKFKILLDLDELPSDVNISDIIESIKLEANKEGSENKSFIALWKLLREKVLNEVSNKNANLVSFDGHGSVKSFSPKVVQYQENLGVADPKLFSSLGYTEIDSYYQEGKQPFYQRSSEDLKEMNWAANVIQDRWLRSKKIDRKSADRRKKLGEKESKKSVEKEKIEFLNKRYIESLDGDVIDFDLLEQGVDINLKNTKDKETALVVAFRKKDKGEADIDKLLTMGASVGISRTPGGETIIDMVCRNIQWSFDDNIELKRNEEILNKLLTAWHTQLKKNDKINEADGQGRTLLFCAAQSGNLDLVKELFAQKADLFVTNRDGYDIFSNKVPSAHLGSERKERGERLSSIKTTLSNLWISGIECGSYDIERKNSAGETALLYAILQGNIEGVEKLLELGANVNAEANGKKWVEYANFAKKNKDEIIEMMNQYVAKKQKRPRQK